MRWIALAALCVVGCLGSRTTVCDNGAICPADQACTERAEVFCGPPAEVDACRDPSATTCSTTDVPSGRCVSGVCIRCEPDVATCRFDVWTAMGSPVATDLNALRVLAPDDAYAVGVGGSVFHYDGLHWQSVAELGASNQLVGIWGTDADHLFVAETGGKVFQSPLSATPASTAPVSLYRIWGTTPTRVVAVGNSATTGIYNGSTWTWTTMTLASFRPLNDVMAGSSTMYAVGNNGTVMQLVGSTWSFVGGFPTADQLIGAWANGNDELFVVGTNAGAGVAFHYQGTWQQFSLPAGTATLKSVWGSAANDVFAVGSRGTILHYDGSTWTVMDAPDMIELNAVAGSGSDVFVVGGGGAIWRLARR